MRRIEKIVIFIGLFIILYNPPLLPLNSMHLVGLISIFYLTIHQSYTQKKLQSKKVALFILWCIGLLIYYVIVAFTSSNATLTEIIQPYIIFLIDILPFSLVVKHIYQKRNYTTNDFLSSIIQVALLQSTIAILALIIPSFQETIVQLYINYGYEETFTSLSKHRLYGLAGGLTFSTPALHGIISVLAIELSRHKGAKYLLYAALIAFTGIINARLTIVIILIGACCIILLGKISAWKKALVIALIFGGYSFITYLATLPQYQLTFGWIMDGIEEILGFLQGNSGNETYFSYIFNPNRYAVPKSFFALIFGEGHSIIGGLKSYGVYSDIGYINDIWIGGFASLFLLSLFWGNILKCFFKSKEKIIKFSGMFLLFSLLVLNIKGPVFKMNDVTCFILIFYFVCVTNSKTMLERL